MSAIINSENYEAFYLDYLEGNLNEADTHALLLFLRANPELNLEDDALPVLNPENTAVDVDFKQQLCVFDVQETISMNNVEQFMIARVENILPSAKQKELELFLENNESLKQDFKLYQLTRLEADATVSYPHKQTLKQTRIIPLLWRSVAIAASLIGIIALSYWLPEDSVNINPTAHISASFMPGKINLPTKTEPYVSVEQKAKDGLHLPTFNTNQRNSKNTIALLPFKDANRVQTDIYSTEIAALHISSAPANTKTLPTRDVTTSFVSFAEMKNPIQPITKGIKTRFNKDVDLRTAKATKTKQGGFYLKIGKLEIMRKKAPTDAVLAAN